MLGGGLVSQAADGVTGPIASVSGIRHLSTPTRRLDDQWTLGMVGFRPTAAGPRLAAVGLGNSRHGASSIHAELRRKP